MKNLKKFEKDYSSFEPLLKTQQDKEEFMTWVSFLQVGVFKKGTKMLQRDRNKYCCLGVACAVTIPDDKIVLTSDQTISGAFPDTDEGSPNWLADIDNEFEERCGVHLYKLNDAYGYSHPEIAEVILLLFGHEL